MNTADPAMVATMELRLASTLRKLKNRGKLVVDKQDGKNMRGVWHDSGRGCPADPGGERKAHRLASDASVK